MQQASHGGSAGHPHADHTGEHAGPGPRDPERQGCRTSREVFQMAGKSGSGQCPVLPPWRFLDRARTPQGAAEGPVANCRHL